MKNPHPAEFSVLLKILETKQHQIDTMKHNLKEFRALLKETNNPALVEFETFFFEK